jgi:hypothetical protein
MYVEDSTEEVCLARPSDGHVFNGVPQTYVPGIMIFGSESSSQLYDAMNSIPVMPIWLGGSASSFNMLLEEIVSTSSPVGGGDEALHERPKRLKEPPRWALPRWK